MNTSITVKQELYRGCLPFSAPRLNLKNYFFPDKLPSVPNVFGHVANNYAWGMLGNDHAGTCVLAGAAHEEMLWHMAGRKTAPVFTTDSVLRQYLVLTNGQDSGLNPVEVAKWRIKTGLTDSGGAVHKLRAFAAADSLDELVTAAYLFGAAGLGLVLPTKAEQDFAKGQVWSHISGKPSAGHYMPLVGRNSHGNLVVITWGQLQGISPAYAQHYFLGGLAYINTDYMLANGLSPEGFNQQQLDEDLRRL